MTTQFKEGFVLNHTPFEVTANDIYLILSIKRCKEELELGEFNAENGKPADMGRIYVSENDVKKYIDDKANSGYFTVKLPEEAIAGTFKDNLNESINYYNVKFDSLSRAFTQFVGLTTRESKYAITSSGIKKLDTATDTQEVDMIGHQIHQDYHLLKSLKAR